MHIMSKDRFTHFCKIKSDNCGDLSLDKKKKITHFKALTRVKM